MDRVTSSGLVLIERSAFTDPMTPNGNDPADVPPATVGPPTARPGDPNGFEIIDDGEPGRPFGGWPPRAAPWSGWPAEWQTPNWWGQVQLLTDTAWMCLDSNSSILATMPAYLVNAARSLDSDWLNNPDPDLYTGWIEFLKQVVWDYQCAGEVFILATAYYATGKPARFHVVAPWLVDVELDGAVRRYLIGSVDVTADILHIRYTSRVGDAHGHGPLEVGGPRLVAAAALARYAQQVALSGGVPNSVLTHPARLTAKQAGLLQQQWVEARMSSLGLPAVLSGGVEFKTLTVNPKDAALVELSQWNESRIAVLLSVPPFCVALPSGGDPMTYSNVNSIFVYRWRAGLNPLAAELMEALSNWLLPRGTTLELNRDEFLHPSELERAQASETWVRIGALTPEQVAERERFSVAAPSPTLSSGVLQ